MYFNQSYFFRSSINYCEFIQQFAVHLKDEIQVRTKSIDIAASLNMEIKFITHQFYAYIFLISNRFTRSTDVEKACSITHVIVQGLNSCCEEVNQLCMIAIDFLNMTKITVEMKIHVLYVSGFLNRIETLEKIIMDMNNEIRKYTLIRLHKHLHQSFEQIFTKALKKSKMTRVLMLTLMRHYPCILWSWKHDCVQFLLDNFCDNGNEEEICCILNIITSILHTKTKGVTFDFSHLVVILEQAVSPFSQLHCRLAVAEFLSRNKLWIYPPYNLFEGEIDIYVIFFSFQYFTFTSFVFFVL